MVKRRIAIIGPDNTGKHAVGRELSRAREIEVIEPTGYEHSKSIFLRTLGMAGRALTLIGDRLSERTSINKELAKFVADTGYVWNLFLYSTLGRLSYIGRDVVYVRYPPVDTDLHEKDYLVGSNRTAHYIQRFIAKILSGKRKNLDAMDTIIYLRVNKDNILARFDGSKGRQIHERSEDSLSKLIDAYEKRIEELKNEGKRVITIDTNNQSLEQVVEAVKIEVNNVPSGDGFSERLEKRYSPFSASRIDNTFERLTQKRKLDPRDIPHIKKGIKENEYYGKCLLTCAAISLADPSGFFAEIYTLAIREAFISTMLVYEIAKLRSRRALWHALMLPFGAIPKIGGICYLTPIIANDPKTGIFLTYHLCNYITKRDPDEIMYKIGSFPPFRIAGIALYHSGLLRRIHKSAGTTEKYRVDACLYNLMLRPFIDGAIKKN